MVGIDRPVYVPSQHKHNHYSVQDRKNFLGSHSCNFVNTNFLRTKLLHAYTNYVYIVIAKYQSAPKAVVGIDRHVYVPSKHKHNPYSVQARKIVQVLVNNIFLSTKLLHAYTQCVFIV